MVNPNAKLPGDVQNSAFYEKFGIFLNASTLEIELNDSRCIHLMNSVMQALCDVEAAKERFQELADASEKAKEVITIADPKRFIKDIEYVGKGRFAQRLCAEMYKVDVKEDVCPPYILKALKHVTG